MTIIIREEGKTIFYMGPYLVYAKSEEDAKEQVERWHSYLNEWSKSQSANQTAEKEP